MCVPKLIVLKHLTHTSDRVVIVSDEQLFRTGVVKKLLQCALLEIRMLSIQHCGKYMK